MISLVARTDQLAEVVAALHARAAAATGATRTALLELQAGTVNLHPTSVTGFDALDSHPWMTHGAEAALAAGILAAGRMRQVTLRAGDTPELTRRLGTAAAVLAPVTYAGQPLGRLVLGLPAVTPALEWSDSVSDCADGFALAIVRARRHQDVTRQHEIQELIVALGRSGTPTIPIDRFEAFCIDVCRVVAADRVELWLHDRQAKQLDLAASSDRQRQARVTPVGTADPLDLVAATLRQQRSALVAGVPDGSTSGVTTATVPLRGRRRALGVVLIEGIRVHPGDETRTLDQLDGLGLQLANVIESTQLLGDVMRTAAEERRIGAERAALRERLSRSEALGQLVAGIAHELNNPLQSVLGHVELLQQTQRLSAPLSSGLRQVYREADRAARIVRNLLLLAGSGKLARRPISINAAMRRTLSLRAPACRAAKITLVRDLGVTVPRISGDALLLQQAFLNLVVNAEQAIGGRGGRIDVRTSYAARRKQVTVEIRDDGTGIATEDLPRVFDPFFTTKESGSGLGLAMTLRIIREHGGDIVAAQRPGGGAVFSVHLPTTPAVHR